MLACASMARRAVSASRCVSRGRQTGKRPEQTGDPRYADLVPSDVPMTESLKETVARFLPYWREAIAPAIVGERVLIAAHGNRPARPDEASRRGLRRGDRGSPAPLRAPLTGDRRRASPTVVRSSASPGHLLSTARTSQSLSDSKSRRRLPHLREVSGCHRVRWVEGQGSVKARKRLPVAAHLDEGRT
jgi:hypothetical protein